MKLIPLGQAEEDGFTIIELLISTTIFTLLLMLCLATLIQVGRMYFKGVTTANTQTTARTIIDDLSRAVQFSGQVPRAGTPANYGIAPLNITVNSLCIGNTRYSYVTDRQVSNNPSANAADKEARHAVWRDNTPDGACTPQDLTLNTPTPLAAPSSGQEMVGVNMRIMNFGITAMDPINQIWKITAWVSYGDTDLLDYTAQPGHAICDGSKLGTQFCANSEFDTLVSRRVGA